MQLSPSCGLSGELVQGGERALSREDEIKDEPPFAFEDVGPNDKPFPLSDAECARLVRGHLVRWRGTLASD